MNGRVDIIGDKKKKFNCNWYAGCPKNAQFLLADKIPVNAKPSAYREALTGNWESNNLAIAFFSEKNVQMVQNGIRAGVYEKSQQKYLIGPQNIDSLKIIMRSVFLQHSKNLETNIQEQITQLNQIVYDYAIPQILGEATGYIKYKRDISTLAVPLSHPKYMSKAGTNKMEMKPWF